jgi:hypothetical protein
MHTQINTSNVTSNTRCTKKTLKAPFVLQSFSLLNRKRLLQILATSFTEETRAKMREREEWKRWEKFEHNNSRERIDVK